jgi:hypothetical protein
MNAQELTDTARTLVAGDKGLLAMDESNPTCNKRFAKLGIPQATVVDLPTEASGTARLASVGGVRDVAATE